MTFEEYRKLRPDDVKAILIDIANKHDLGNVIISWNVAGCRHVVSDIIVKLWMKNVSKDEEPILYLISNLGISELKDISYQETSGYEWSKESEIKKIVEKLKVKWDKMYD